MMGRGSVGTWLLAVARATWARLRMDGANDPAFRRAFEEEGRESNARIIAMASCIAVPVRVLSVIFFFGRAETDPARVAWVVVAGSLQVLEAAFAVFMGIVAWRRRPEALWRVLGDVMGVVGLLGAAAMSANAQRAYPNMNLFVIAAVFIAFFLRMRAAVFVSALLSAAAIVVLAMAHFPRDPAARMADVLALAAATGLGLFGFFVVRSMRARELMARRDVEQLNADLERRVEAQVGEIVARAREIEGLNAQLNEKIRERSRELSAALARLAEDHRPLDRGVVLAGRVELEAPIGQGAMGTVYRGRDLVTDRAVAVKVLHATSANELDGLHRFLREAEALASVTHHAIVRTYHVDVSEDGRLFQVMELVEGVTLDARLGRIGSLSEGAAARLVAVLAEALAAAHAAGLVHRDVKPSNVMLTRAAPGLKLLDFGISKLRDPSPSGDHTGRAILGTPEFVSPEQINAPGTVAAPADVYALGLVLYRCLSGRMPFEPDTIRNWLIMHLVKPPTDISRLVPGLDPTLAKTVMACLDKDPAARPTAAAMAATLTEIADARKTPPLQALDLSRRTETDRSGAVTRDLTDEAFRTRETMASSGDQPSSDRPASDRPASDRPASDRPASDRPASDRSLDRAASERR